MISSFSVGKATRRARSGTAVRALTALLVVALAHDAAATNHILRQDQLMIGFNGDPTVQYLVITVGGTDQKSWGPQGNETTSRAMLAFFNSNGVQTGTFFFPHDPPQGGLSVLIATTNFANIPGAPVPDILIPPLMNPSHGKVTFRGNTANPARFDVTLSLSYGNFPAALTDGAGLPAPSLPFGGEATSLTRIQDFTFGIGSSKNINFALRPASPLNTRGETFTFPVDGPEIDPFPASVDFPGINLAAGATAPRTVTLTSRGTINPLIITNIALAGANANQFNLLAGGGGPFTLPPGATRTVDLNFDPNSVGTKTASLRIISNDTNEMVTDVVLTGFGIDPNAPDIAVNPTNATFGIRDIALGASPSVGLLVNNVGNIGTLFFSSFSMTGRNTNDFRILSDTGQSSLGPGASRALSLVFTPASAGPKSAALRIASNDPDEGQVFIPLSAFAFDLNPCTAPNPTNSVSQDLSTNAMLVCPGMEFSGPLPLTAPDGQSSCQSAGGDAWFRYVPAASGVLTVNLQGIGMTPVLSAHSSAPGTPANELACQSAAGSNSPIAQLSLVVTAGETIVFRVASANSTIAGQFILALAGPPCFEFDRNRNGTTDTCESDFGSAPAPFPTRLSVNGARHRAFTAVFLGARVDANDDGLPSIGATGDKLDGPENDEDGVVFTSGLTIGQLATVSVTASTNGILNSWIDFNADGDWNDPGERIFTNAPLATGVNALSFLVPSNSVATNRTYARFRFSTTSNLGVTGFITDGEVEDYAVEILPVTVTPGALQVRLNEVMVGLNGDSTVQFVELQVASDADKLWGPQSGETAGRAMLAFFDEAGSQIGRFVFPSNAPAGGTTVLVATRAFSEQTGLRPDFFMPPELSPVGGRVAFMANPDNLRFSMNISLAYGGGRYFGLTGGAGPANTNEVPILGAKSLARTAPVPFGVNQNQAFALATPTPLNTAGQTVILTETPLREQGRIIFTRETFRGNGRTCATCHIADGRDQFGLTPSTILELPEEDPLFVFEQNVNVLKLVLRSQPSDLRGPVTGTLGNARILGGSGDSFVMVGGTNLAGLVSDTNGNVGILQSVTPGNLIGPTPGNGSARGLEDHGLLEHGRGLILENIDGFKHTEVFRTSPHLLNIALTAPYGLSGEFSNLDDFSVGAVIQHFPRTLARVSGVDFRQPTRAEMAAMTEFMNTIFQPADQSFDLDRFATTEAQKRGRTLFFSNEGKCSQCHSGPTLSHSDGSLFGSISNVNENFNTGVANLLRNIADGLPTEPAGLLPGQSTRAFNTPPLMGIRLSAPFFHDGVAATLKEAVEFYDTEQFVQSPAGQLVGTILAANREEKVADLVAFLESLVEVPVEFTRDVTFGIRCPGDPVHGPFTATVTNMGATTVAITNVAFNGEHAADFSIVADTGQNLLAPGQTRSVTVAFGPAAKGGKNATLEFSAVDTNLLGRFEFGVALWGADIDNIVTVAPATFNFGARDIDAPPSPEISLLVTNDGTVAVDLSGFTVTGANPQDFVVTADTSLLAPHDVRVIQVSFAPKTAGAKSASIRIPVLACNTSMLDIPLAGTASSTVHHFGWEPLGGTQYVGTAFAVRLSAQDRNNDTVTAFGGTVRLTGLGLPLIGPVSPQAVPITPTVAITPTNSAPFVNGVWMGSITVLQPSPFVTLVARDNQGHIGLSDTFLAPLRDDISLVATDSPDPVIGGQAISYTFTVHNTGPGTATGVTLADTLPTGVAFASGDASLGTITHAAGMVSWQLGSLTSGFSATGTVVALPIPGFASVTNIAVLTRNELEINLGNNLATNVTSIQPFGLLTVTPGTNFESAGFSGGPFTPANKVFVVSNAGNATLDWQARSGGCTLPAGLVSWWRGEGNALDSVGTNHGTLMNGATFAPAVVGQGFFFDGVNDFVLVNDGPTLDLTNEITVELWYKLNRVSGEPLFDKREFGGRGNYGATLSSQHGIQVFYNDITVGGVEISVVPPPLPATDIFHHFAATFRQLNSNFVEVVTFVDGIAVLTTTMPGSLARAINDVPFFIGAEGGPGAVFSGIIDEVSLYNRALSASEIRQVFEAGADGKCQGSVGTSNCSPPVGITGWWPMDDNLLDIIGTNVGRFTGNPVFTNGQAGRALFFDGTDDGVRFSASPSLNVGTNLGFTLESWIFVPDLRLNPIFEWNDETVNVGPHLWVSQNSPGTLFANLVDTTITSHQIISSPNLVAAGVWQHVGLTYNRSNGLAKLFVNGVVVQQQNLGIFTPRTGIDFWLGRRATVPFQHSFVGAMDEPSVYGRELGEAEIQSIFVAGPAGKCRNQSWFSQAPFSGTLPPGGRTNVVVSINTNANTLAVGSYSAPLQFTNTSNARGTAERGISLNVINRQPTLNPLGPILIAEDTGPRGVQLAGIRAGGLETQRLTVSAVSDKSSLIVEPITVNYASPATTGSILLALVPNAHGTAVVSVVVRDDAGTANGALDAVTNSFVVTVTPVNDPPTLALISDRTINEGALLLITNVLTDPDLPNDQHVFSLLAPPSGATIGSSDGVFNWRPGEDQGPGTNLITVVVRDSGVPQLSATNRFALAVLEVNSPPVLTVPASRTVLPGVPVSLTVNAVDADLPANALAFTLGPGAPAGATLSTTTGLFSWTPPLAPVPGTNVFTFIATDNGTPMLSDQEVVTLVVVNQPVIESIASSGATVTIRWSALPGVRYQVQFKTSLSQASWADLPGDVVATGSTATKSDSTAAGDQRFYKVTVLP